ncbi:MAG TPA: N-acetyltransferase [Caldithrix abyssi]|uniref:N-acetyltransferase n=1 Tax=Caldithrix abyssi TaxID=187145 RepID=A0A7V4WX37_CALAY|nr:N-acetyltransferase [Caldithrix abyssi]
MKKNNAYEEVNKAKQNHLLKLVTNSFYRELVNYGIDAGDIVKVSVNLLDHVTEHKAAKTNNNGYYNTVYKLADLENRWMDNRELRSNDVLIRPLAEEHISRFSFWLQNTDVDKTFIRFFPKEEVELKKYCLNRDDRSYFAIYFQGDQFAGVIGGENINHEAKKLEMKKFVGEPSLQGKGIGKAATFLFLYYTFHILSFNKIYIHSLDTNIKNINLNSKFGFDLEGILYQEVCIGAVYHDVLRMSLLRETWDRIFLRHEK